MMSAKQGDTQATVINIVMTNDGKTFSVVRGKITSRKKGTISVDFSPIGGPASATATYLQGALTWFNGHVWKKQAVPTITEPSKDQTSGGYVGGFYVYPNHYHHETFVGTRMIAADKSSKVLTVIGSDDDKSFWTLPGKIG